MMVNGWCIPANSGWSKASFEDAVCHATGEIEFVVRLTGKFWYRAGTGQAASELVDDFEIVLPSVLIPKLACEQLLDHLNTWLRKRSAFVMSLASAPDQKLQVQISQRDDLITSVDRPALTVLYDAPSCRLEIFFVVDQTCVEQARSQLQRVMTEFTNDLI